MSCMSVAKLDMSNNAYNVVDNSFKVFLAYIDLSSITSVKRRQHLIALFLEYIFVIRIRLL